MNGNRLYVFTGKGGVGKSTLASAFSYQLHKESKNVLYVYFEPPEHLEDLNNFGIPTYELDLQNSVEAYVAKKLGSKIIANWVVNTKFFSALISMVPGFSYLVFLGHILEKIKIDPNLVIVLDSPSSGHALTMFESTYNFHDIFKSGLLVDDINKMLEFAHNENILKIIIGAFPSQMAIHEAIELKEKLSNMNFNNTEILANNSLMKVSGLEVESLPDFLKQKINLEKEVFDKYKDVISNTLPHSLQENFSDRVLELSNELKLAQ